MFASVTMTCSNPWYPMGTANMLQVLHMGLHVCQIMGYEQINDGLKLISSHSARTLNVQDRYGIEVGKPANLLILPAENGFDAVRRQVPVRYSNPPRQGDCPDPPGPDRNRAGSARADRFSPLRFQSGWMTISSASGHEGRHCDIMAA